MTTIDVTERWIASLPSDPLTPPPNTPSSSKTLALTLSNARSRPYDETLARFCGASDVTIVYARNAAHSTALSVRKRRSEGHVVNASRRGQEVGVCQCASAAPNVRSLVSLTFVGSQIEERSSDGGQSRSVRTVNKDRQS